jgi:hypothetical protein
VEVEIGQRSRSPLKILETEIHFHLVKNYSQEFFECSAWCPDKGIVALGRLGEVQAQATGETRWLMAVQQVALLE